MSDNVLRLSDYRQPFQSAADPPRDPAELASMAYDAAVDWAGADFWRLVAVAKARDYRPEWIAHQLENRGLQPSAQEAGIVAHMVAVAGPYRSRRQRWILRQLHTKPMTEKTLAVMAGSAVEYRRYKDIPRCVRHDINRLTSLGLVREHSGKVHAVDLIDVPGMSR